MNLLLTSFIGCITATSVIYPNETGEMSSVVMQLCRSVLPELLCMLLCLLVFAALRLDLWIRRTRWPIESKLTHQLKTLRTFYNAGKRDKALAAWRHSSIREAEVVCPLEDLRMVTHALLEDGADFVEMAHYLANFKTLAPCVQLTTERQWKNEAVMQSVQDESSARTFVVNVILGVVATHAPSKTSDAFKTLKEVLALDPNEETFEVMLTAADACGSATQIERVLRGMSAAVGRVTPRAFAVAVRSLARGKHWEAALRCLAMAETDAPMVVTTFVDFTKSLLDASPHRPETMIHQLLSLPGQLPAEAANVLLDFAIKSKDIALGERIETAARRKGALVQSTYEMLVKLYALFGNNKSITIFNEMIRVGCRISDPIRCRFLAVCAESKYIALPERIFAHARTQREITLPLHAGLIKVFASSNLDRRVCDLYDDLRSDGFEADAETRALVTRCSARGTVLFGQLQVDHSPIKIEDYMADLRVCRLEKNGPRALELLEEMRKSSLADKRAHDAVVEVCAVSGDREGAMRVVSSMRGKCGVDCATFSALIKGLCTNHRLADAEAVLDSIPTDIATTAPFAMMLNTYLRNNRSDGAWRVHERMLAVVGEDAHALCSLLRAAKSSNDRRFVSNVLSLLDRTKLDMTKDEVLLNVTLELCVRLKETRRLQVILSSVKTAKLTPSVVTVSALMKAFASLRRMDEVNELWRELTIVRRLEPNDVALGCIVDANVSNNRLAAAAALVEEWKSRVGLNCVIYTTLIKGFAMARDSQGALNVLRMMEAANVPKSQVTGNTVLDACARAGNMDDGMLLLDKMHAGLLPGPDRVSYATCIKGFCLQQKVERALDLLPVMRGRGFFPDVIIFNTLLDGCVSQKAFDLCDQVYAAMTTAKVAPSVITLTILIKRCGREGTLDEAFKLVDTLPGRHGFQPNSHTFTCLISACLANKNLRKGLQVLDRMNTHGPAPDAMTYDKLINGCLRVGDALTACSLIRYAHGLGKVSQRSPPGMVPGGLASYIEQFRRFGAYDQHCAPLLGTLRNAGVNVPVQAPGRRRLGESWRSTTE